MPEVRRYGPYQQSGEQGIWLGWSKDTPGASIVCPIKWDENQEAWILRPSITVTRCKVYTGVMALRMRPDDGSSDRDFDRFVDRVCRNPCH